jgi:hypothetical protein
MIALCSLLLLTAAPPGPTAASPSASAPAAAPTPAASPAEALRQAKNTFDYGNYTSAAAMADQLLGSRQLDRAADQLEAYRILGLSRLFLYQTLPARDAFLNLLSLDPDYQLDPFYVPPQAIAFFERVRTDNQALLQPIRERRRATQEAQRQEEAARQDLLAQTQAGAQGKVRVVNLRVERHSPLLALLPFGAGQFQNGSPKLGWTLAISEAVLGATSVACYLWIFGKGQAEIPSTGSDGVTVTTIVPTQGGQYFAQSDIGTARTLLDVQISTGAAFFALWAYGIGDAFLHFNSTVTARDDDGPAASPARPGPQAAVLPVPGGAVGSLRLSF